MNKLLMVATVLPVSVLMSQGVLAAEIYNKDKNKVDLYGKVTAMHYFSGLKKDNGDRTSARGDPD